MRHWLITGAASGLGRCLFEAAVATGDCATATVRRVEDAETLERLAPGRAKAIILDLSDSMVVREVASKLDGIDVLVNNAGYSLEGVVEATSAEEMRALFDVMLFAPVELIKAVLPAMRSQGCGIILNIGSIGAHVQPGGSSIYGSAKAALETLSAGLAREVEPFGVRVVTVVAGAFRTSIGTSRRSVERALPAYAEIDAARREVLKLFTGQQRGDPSRAAAAIMAFVEQNCPADRFALGPDAVDAMHSHASALREQADLLRGLSDSTDFAAA